jgi:hypothetical protein
MPEVISKVLLNYLVTYINLTLHCAYCYYTLCDRPKPFPFEDARYKDKEMNTKLSPSL